MCFSPLLYYFLQRYNACIEKAMRALYFCDNYANNSERRTGNPTILILAAFKKVKKYFGTFIAPLFIVKSKHGYYDFLSYNTKIPYLLVYAYHVTTPQIFDFGCTASLFILMMNVFHCFIAELFPCRCFFALQKS